MGIEAREREGTWAFPALERLDALLADAVERARSELGPYPGADPFRGLHVSAEHVDRLLARAPGAPLEGRLAARNGAAPVATRLEQLAREYGLPPFDVDALLIALGPEVDLRYERVYAYLQDDVTRKRPSVDLALDVLCETREEKLTRRARFLPGAPLRSRRLLDVLPPGRDGLPAPLLAHVLKVDDQIVRVLLGGQGPDARLASFCRLEQEPGADAVPGVTVADAPAEAGLHLHGAPRRDRLEAARALSASAGRALLVADLARPLDPDHFPLAFREADLCGALLYADPLDALGDRPGALEALYDAWHGHRGPIVSGGEAEWNRYRRAGAEPPGVRDVRLVRPGPAERRAVWRHELDRAGADAAGLDVLAERFRLHPAQIRAAAMGGDVFAAARDQTGTALASLATRCEATRGWADIVLAPEVDAQLRELAARAATRERVLGEWGFGASLSGGRSLAALFAGPSGTGKTLAAEVIAHELGVHLYRVNLAGVLSKWVGETEKNLDRIFDAAEGADAVLFFDEADALMGKRAQAVQDALDRYSNVEIAYLLQKLEAFDGVAVLATNLAQNLDPAFTRRLALTVHFPLPGPRERRRIWDVVWPAATPRSDDIDHDVLAERFKLTGAGIRSAVLAAAFRAAAAGRPVRMTDVLHAVEREFAKLGKVLSREELEP